MVVNFKNHLIPMCFGAIFNTHSTLISISVEQFIIFNITFGYKFLKIEIKKPQKNRFKEHKLYRRLQY
jgi:hypothetical protein